MNLFIFCCYTYFLDSIDKVWKFGRMNLTLNNKLREFCMRLRKMVDEGKTDEEIMTEKNAMIEQIYRVVSICLGTPPQVSQSKI